MIKKIILKCGFLFIALLILMGNAIAIPVPHGIDGIILELDGITQVKSGVNFYVEDSTSGQVIYGKTGLGSSGGYSVSLKGNDGSIIVIKAWNKYNQANITVALNGVMRNVNFMLNMTYPPIAPEIISEPVLIATEDAIYNYQVNALDENEDALVFSLIGAPRAMNIDSTGRISWAPADSDAGTHQITVQVSDGIFFTNQTYQLYVDRINDAPKIFSIPAANATQDIEYIYIIDVFDEESDLIEYILAQGPDGMSVNATSGLVKWKPSPSQIGTFDVEVEASDGNSFDVQAFEISVANVNDLPVIITLPKTTAVQGQFYSYDVNASDMDNDALAYSLENGPPGMQIDSSTGLITWTPQNSDVGIRNVTAKVSDDSGYVLQSFAIIVQNVNDKPIIASNPITSATAGRPYSYQIIATDPDNDVLTYTLTEFPEGMSIDTASGLISWTPKKKQAGSHNVAAIASDGNLSDAQRFAIDVQKKSGNSLLASSEIKAIALVSEDSSVIFVTPEEDAAIYVNEFAQRPFDAKKLDKRVYKYIEIESDNGESIPAEINFSVDKSWLDENLINYSDIVLSRHTEGGWADLETFNVSNDGSKIHYSAKTPGFSYFAIAVRDGVKVDAILSPRISKIIAPYRVTGTIYKWFGLVQAGSNTRYYIENLNSSKVFEGQTGIGSSSGAYYLMIDGNANDELKIKISDLNGEYMTKLRDASNLDFMVNLLNNAFLPITKSRIRTAIVQASLPLILLFALITAAVIIKRVKKHKIWK